MGAVAYNKGLVGIPFETHVYELANKAGMRIKPPVARLARSLAR